MRSPYLAADREDDMAKSKIAVNRRRFLKGAATAAAGAAALATHIPASDAEAASARREPHRKAARRHPLLNRSNAMAATSARRPRPVPSSAP